MADQLFITTLRMYRRKPNAACARADHSRTLNELNRLVLHLNAQTVSRDRIP